MTAPSAEERARALMDELETVSRKWDDKFERRIVEALRAAERAGERAAYERAAEVCQKRAEITFEEGLREAALAHSTDAAAIRALAEPEPETAP